MLPISIILAALLLLLPRSLAGADDLPGQVYTWQTDDSLSRLAEKYYDDPADWLAILVATNARADGNSDFDKLLSPTGIQVGQRLWIPDQADAAGLLAHYPKLQPLSDKLLADFENYIESPRQRYQIPGAAVLLVRGNQIVWAKGFGLRELGQPEPVEPDTVFAVGSTTKAMTSMMVASMVDEGLLRWDQPVQEIWPGFTLSDPDRAAQLRLRDMFTMATGLPRRDLVWSGTDLTAEQLMASLAELPVHGEIGQWFDYNNQVVATGGYGAALAADRCRG